MHFGKGKREGNKHHSSKKLLAKKIEDDKILKKTLYVKSREH